MDALQALLILLGVFALGEIVAEKTKAYISTTLAVAAALFAAFWLGLPKNIFTASQISGIAIVLLGILITSQGTLFDVAEFKRQWKTVIIGVAAAITGVAAIIIVCPLIIPREMAVGVAPIFAGANVATLIMTNALKEKGLNAIASFCVLMLVTQNFAGIPYASVMLRKAAVMFKNSPEFQRRSMDLGENKKAERLDAILRLMAGNPELDKNKKIARGGRRLLQLPEVFSKPSCVLAKLALVTCLSGFLSTFTGGVVHYFVITLILGIAFTELGFLEKNALVKSASSGFIIPVTTLVIFTSITDTSPSQLISLIGPLILCLGVGCAGVSAACLLTGKLLKVNIYLAIALGLTCTFGFPTTMLMSKEVAFVIGENNEERAVIENYLLPKMICAGFITVTIFSVVLAGVVVKIL